MGDWGADWATNTADTQRRSAAQSVFGPNASFAPPPQTGISPTNQILPGPYASGYIFPGQAQVLNQLGLTPQDFNAFNTMRDFYTRYYGPQMQDLQTQQGLLQSGGLLTKLHNGFLMSNMREGYGIDMGKIGLQREALARQAMSLGADAGDARRLYDLYRTNAQADLADIPQYLQFAQQQFDSNQGLNAQQRGSVQEQFRLGNEQAAIAEAAQQRAIMNATVAAGAGISGETRHSLDDLAAMGLLGRQGRSQTLQDRLASLADEAIQAQVGFGRAKLGLANDQRDLQYGIDRGQIELDQRLRGIGDAQFNNSIQARGLDLSSQELKNALDRGLANIGFSGQMSALQLMQQLSSNNAQQRAMAEQIMFAALQGATSLPLSNQSITPMSTQEALKGIDGTGKFARGIGAIVGRS